MEEPEDLEEVSALRRLSPLLLRVQRVRLTIRCKRKERGNIYRKRLKANLTVSINTESVLEAAAVTKV